MPARIDHFGIVAPNAYLVGYNKFVTGSICLLITDRITVICQSSHRLCLSYSTESCVCRKIPGVYLNQVVIRRLVYRQPTIATSHLKPGTQLYFSSFLMEQEVLL